MAISNKRLEQIDAELRAAGIPIDGLGVVNGDVTPPTLRVDFQPAATPAQRTQAGTIIAGIDFRARRARPLDALRTAVGALTNAQRNALLNLLVADFLQRNPDAARKLGINLDGDEIVQ